MLLDLEVVIETFVDVGVGGDFAFGGLLGGIYRLEDLSPISQLFYAVP